ncbi:MAG: hypothetical protein LUD27_06045 [Clostridia bacterium]|nr:hypothetical protein [Clostridia bacterium]
MQIAEIVLQAEEIAVYNDGAQAIYKNGEEKFNRITCVWQNMLSSARLMPAFGVSIDNLTREAMKTGVWIEFLFSKEYVINELPFEKLLVQAVKDYTGFNINRCFDGGYNGRCFYINLNGKDMSELYNILINE